MIPEWEYDLLVGGLNVEFPPVTPEPAGAEAQPQGAAVLPDDPDPGAVFAELPPYLRT